jgi:hypothetical protein
MFFFAFDDDGGEIAEPPHNGATLVSPSARRGAAKQVAALATGDKGQVEKSIDDYIRNRERSERVRRGPPGKS